MKTKAGADSNVLTAVALLQLTGEFKKLRWTLQEQHETLLAYLRVKFSNDGEMQDDFIKLMQVSQNNLKDMRCDVDKETAECIAKLLKELK